MPRIHMQLRKKSRIDSIEVRKYVEYLPWIELIAGIVITSILYGVSKDPLSFMIGFVAIYFAIVSLINRENTRVAEKRHEEIIEEITKLKQKIDMRYADLPVLYARKIEDIGYGKFELSEKDAVDLMKDNAAQYRYRMVATSYYDFENWLNKGTMDDFWSEYDAIAQNTLSKMVNIIKNKQENFEEYLEANPIITRIFIVDIRKNDDDIDKKIRCLKKVEEMHQDILGYDIRFILKDHVVGKIALRDDSVINRKEQLHDFVMFDDKIIVELVQMKSQWGKEYFNTCGLLFTYTQEKGNLWIDKFDTYFRFLLRESLSFNDLAGYFNYES